MGNTGPKVVIDNPNWNRMYSNDKPKMVLSYRRNSHLRLQLLVALLKENSLNVAWACRPGSHTTL